MGNSISFVPEDNGVEKEAVKQFPMLVSRTKTLHHVEVLGNSPPEHLKNVLILAYRNENRNHCVALLCLRTFKFLRVKQFSQDARNVYSTVSPSLGSVISFQNKSIWICARSKIKVLRFETVQESSRIKAIVVPTDESQNFLTVVGNRINVWSLIGTTPIKTPASIEIDKCEYIHSISPLTQNNLVIANVVNIGCNSSSFYIVDWKSQQVFQEFNCEALCFSQNIILNPVENRALVISLKSCDLSVNLLCSVQVLSWDEQSSFQCEFSENVLVLTSTLKAPTVFYEKGQKTIFFFDYEEDVVWYSEFGCEKEIKRLFDVNFSVKDLTSCKVISLNDDTKKKVIAASKHSKRLDLYSLRIL